VLEDGGCYFDPENADSIVASIRELIENTQLRYDLAARAEKLSTYYSWERCARETWTFLVDTYKQVHG